MRAVRRLARRALAMELAMWASLFRFALRRPRVPPGAVAFRYHGGVMTLLVVFIVLSAVEIPIVDLLVHPWPPVRIAFLVLGVWGLTWMIGLALGYVTRPHAVGPAGLLVRHGPELAVELPWDDLRTVGRARVPREPGSPRLATDDAGRRILSLPMNEGTNLEAVLDAPRRVRLPSGDATIDVVRYWADAPDDYLAQVRRFVDARV